MQLKATPSIYPSRWIDGIAILPKGRERYQVFFYHPIPGRERPGYGRKLFRSSPPAGGLGLNKRSQNFRAFTPFFFLRFYMPLKISTTESDTVNLSKPMD